jgi:serine/threonine-protein kinase RsbT
MKVKIQIVSEPDAIIARQKGREIAKKLGFSVVDQTRIAISISELARNILLYADRGTIVIEALEEADRIGIGIRAVDQGPGIPDPDMAMIDGFTTSGGLGMGLPGTKRLMDDFDLQTSVGKGTAVTIHKWIR